MASLKEGLPRLDQSRFNHAAAQVEIYISSLQDSLNHIGGLSDELLTLIFRFSVLSSSGSSIFAISQTSRRWRQIAESNPALWTLVDLRQLTLAQASSLVQRSLQLPLTVVVGPSRPGNSVAHSWTTTAEISFCVDGQVGPRVEVLELGGRSWVHEFWPKHLRKVMATLKALRCNGTREYGPLMLRPLETRFGRPICWEKLESLTLINTFLPWSSLCAMKLLKKLHVSTPERPTGRSNDQLDSDMLAALAECPILEDLSLHFEGRQPLRGFPRVADHKNSTPLRSLQQLRLHMPPLALSMILSALQYLRSSLCLS